MWNIWTDNKGIKMWFSLYKYDLTSPAMFSKQLRQDLLLINYNDNHKNKQACPEFIPSLSTPEESV